MKYYVIINIETLDLAVVSSDVKPENSVLVTDESLNFIKPKANNIVFTEVVEGITPEEIAELNNQKVQEYRERIGVEVEKLNRSALRRAVGKDDAKYDFMTEKQLNDLRNDTYPRKKVLAETYLSTGTITNQTLFNSMFNIECEVDFAGIKLFDEVTKLNKYPNVNIPTEVLTRMQIFCYIVVTKYALGSFLFEELTTLSEVFRITSLTRLDLLQFDKLDAGFLLLQDLHLIEDLEGFYNLETQFNAL